MTFDRAFAFVVGHEGGYSNDPRDPGGETQYGISKRAYPDLDIKALTLDQARDIYFRDYWVASGCGTVADEVMAILIFDCAVNQGVGKAKQFAARAKTPVEFQAERALHYASLPTFARFGPLGANDPCCPQKCAHLRPRFKSLRKDGDQCVATPKTLGDEPFEEMTENRTRFPRIGRSWGG